MRSRILAGFAAVALFAAGCLQETAGPDNDPTKDPKSVPFAVTIGDPDLATLIEAQLTCLYTDSGLLPNYASSRGKFDQVKAALAADPQDLQGALDATANLVRFILLKYSQYTGTEPINCDPPVDGFPNPVAVGDLVNGLTGAVPADGVITNLWAFVGLTGEICEVPAGQPKLCKTPDLTSGFVYFPGSISDQITYVSIEEDPPALTDLFDEFFNRFRIVTLPLSDFGPFPVKPLVVVCFNGGVVPSDNSILSRLLVFAKHSDTDAGFLPRADLLATYGAAVLQEAVDMCGLAPSTSAMFSPRTALGRFGNGLFDWLLPKPLQASVMEELAFGGAGGATEQFSDFGVADPGMNAFGGAGGATEQFAPPASVMSSGGRANAQYNPGTSTVTGKAGETETDAGDLPSVTVVAPSSGTPIPGVEVTFALQNPSNPLYSGNPSLATLCGEVKDTTGPDGVANLKCLNFGTTVGYKNLQVTFNPLTVDPLACVIVAEGGLCNSTGALNFLVHTTPGDPALVMTYMPPATPPTIPPIPPPYPYPGTPPAFVDVNPSPQAIVTDAYYNGVPGVSILWTPNTINGSTVGGGATATTTSGPGGLSSVTWNLGDGSNLLSADISGTVAGAQPAQFIANTPTGISGFSCALGGSKTDLGFLSIKRPTNTVRTINLWMSVTGQSNFLSAYDVTVTVHTGIPTVSNKVGEKVSGLVQLPGNNGNPTAVSFTLTDLVFPTETNGTQALWLKFTFKDQPPNNLPPTRKIQVWYQNATFRNNQLCYDSKAYAPGSTTSFKRGLSINVTN